MDVELLDLQQPQRVSVLFADNERAAGAAHAAPRIVELAQQLARQHDPRTPAAAVYVPGRIEVLGKHTDYAGGRSLTCAVTKSFIFVAVRTDEPGVRLQDYTLTESRLLPWVNPLAGARGSWTVYPGTVVDRIARNFGEPGNGVSLLFSSSIPSSAGLSSSSALVTGCYLAIAALCQTRRTNAWQQNIQCPEDLAAWLGSVENGFSFRNLEGKQGVGTRGGAQDHAAVLFSTARALGAYRYRPLQKIATAPLPADLCFVVASSGVKASKSTNALHKYNNAVARADAALDAWNSAASQDHKTLGSAIEDPAFSPESFQQFVHDAGYPDAKDITQRIQQFCAETKIIVPGAVRALKAGDISEFGRLVSESQRMTDELLHNQVQETRWLARTATEEGALAASAFGAGFGGSVWALVPTANASVFTARWAAAYGRRFPGRLREAMFFPDGTGPGAFVLGDRDGEILFEPQLRPDSLQA